ncbi:hypothetical protein PoB_006594600 [Plakobranchus ocellatus]|uniref:Uncharacterized protein n=1 Tax=Plakobranchus ocellatus TaxID=259542 RepID=A0AAV4D5T6_9GAST|nr:hypothetical protein PoB_006594600 [Plakobranchus ocellatus]
MSNSFTETQKFLTDTNEAPHLNQRLAGKSLRVVPCRVQVLIRLSGTGTGEHSVRCSDTVCPQQGDLKRSGPPSAKAPVTELELATVRFLQMLGRVRYPLCHQCFKRDIVGGN